MPSGQARFLFVFLLFCFCLGSTPSDAQGSLLAELGEPCGMSEIKPWVSCVQGICCPHRAITQAHVQTIVFVLFFWPVPAVLKGDSPSVPMNRKSTGPGAQHSLCQHTRVPCAREH